jgi:hypothetical protein
MLPKKSTITGLSDFKTTSSKVASVIANAIISLFNVYVLSKIKTVLKLKLKQTRHHIAGISFL